MRRTDEPADLVVTGLGLVTPAGIGAEATWRGLLTARPTAGSDPLLAGLPVDFSCRVPGFDGAGLLGRRLAARLDRAGMYALVAAREAMTDAGLDSPLRDASRVAVVLGVGTCSFDTYEAEFAKLARGRPDKVSPLAVIRSVPSMIPAEVALDLGARGPNLAVSTACASGTSALGVAQDLLRGGRCDVVLAGGAESVCARVPATCFHQMQALSRRRHDPAAASRPFDRDRDGFVLSEGAGILVLERAAHARARGARPRARFAGYGASCDAHHPAMPHPEGRGAADAIRAALADGGLSCRDIGHVNAHGTATRQNDLAEYEALRRVFADPPPVTSLKGTLGHAVGGAGGIEAACTVLTLEHQMVPPTANLDDQDPAIRLDVVRDAPRAMAMSAAISSSFGFGGQNAVVAFTVP
ncbi:3-oxoacyl-[acyl-carrier-protein] synthase 2 [Streptomyces netropsis]|uniref:3-oxoacyl-[acyl-carrier-protein] synthase II n=1 Tax=Streptomyces syringium TaxID=76729 RepID=A0ABS4YCJ4_9ACTN|nr:beta-ketoacyl-[acyl-carrier-protein] synthase family protein [Streptomyces syringium]MBP2406525.1 3-oxoacyl-[acyl-carrier-protein] synthase II [Streptomyces syringium]SPE63580.1 3-oxoacyl-[acyl-carrier-protein] synthase 2 [Streptomyces netropsis]